MKKSVYFALALLGLTTLSCQPDEVVVTETGSDVQARLSATANFSARQQLGTVKDGSLNEISGLAMSRTNSGYMWVHEDSGNANRVYLIDTQGRTVLTLNMPDANRDWEDIAVGRGPQPNTWYVYVADVGNNSLNTSVVNVYRFVEPSIAGRSLPTTINLSNSAVEKLDFAYADGRHNCETLMVDTNGDLYFITKEDFGENKVSNPVKGGVYRAAAGYRESGTNTLTRLSSLNILTATGGDISNNGQEVLIKNYNTVYYWKKSSSSQTIAQLLTTAPRTLPYTAEPGGEAIGWKVDGAGYYTVSEIKNNIPAAIYYYARQ
ncbi:hypothetical protein DYU11_13210 [Fibrisoma montanum]|uniref:PE-PGRS family protein n=1 Tax=Fibrisoma montanum TaxID=2305895 RepID=A0A418MC21_9BACT|nr:hypothetical protein [Fibrisoma montanum]RIV23917.1 hypothetical protein DYU11_13210 [Fibrisoma montanum]